jgi:APA family basic amino acid/polyamine antiporter
VTATGRPASDVQAEPAAPGLLRSLGATDGALITIGASVGSGIFLTTGDIAQRCPQPALILGLWAAGGLFALAGALAYGELGAMFPRAGGQYQFLKEAYGPLWGFLFGWTSFLVIMTGGVAAIAVGFGEYLGAFVPSLGSNVELLKIDLAGLRWTVHGPQLSAAVAVLGLTAVNWLGVREGAVVQNVVTAMKFGALLVLVFIGLRAPAPVAPAWGAPLPPGSIVAALGLGLVAVLWTYDGWYVLSFSAGEIRKPARTPRVGEAAATALLGPGAARAVTLVILLSMFGCLAANVLCCARIYLPMAEDGLFFRALARIDPRHHTPSASLLAQGLLAAAIALSGTYAELYTTVVFAGVLFHAATAAAVFVLRRTRPDAERPFRAWGHPWTTGAFVAVCLVVASVTLVQAPVRSVLGLGLIAAGLPAYVWWSRARQRR